MFFMAFTHYLVAKKIEGKRKESRITTLITSLVLILKGNRERGTRVYVVELSSGFFLWFSSLFNGSNDVE